jgi:hypothetical protein
MEHVHAIIMLSLEDSQMSRIHLSLGCRLTFHMLHNLLIYTNNTASILVNRGDLVELHPNQGNRPRTVSFLQSS